MNWKTIVMIALTATLVLTLGCTQPQNPPTTPTGPVPNTNPVTPSNQPGAPPSGAPDIVNDWIPEGTDVNTGNII